MSKTRERESYSSFLVGKLSIPKKSQNDLKRWWPYGEVPTLTVIYVMTVKVQENIKEINYEERKPRLPIRSACSKERFSCSR